MTYKTGTAASFADLKTVIESAATEAGWTLSGNTLSQDNVKFQLTAGSQTSGNVSIPWLSLHGGTGLDSSGNLTGQPTVPINNGAAMLASTISSMIVFPINYEIYTFDDPSEVHCIINYNADFYQALSFGRSTNIPGNGGVRAWFTGSYGNNTNLSDTNYAGKCFLGASASNMGSQPFAGIALPYFFCSNSGSNLQASFAHCSFPDDTNTDQPYGRWRNAYSQNAHDGLIPYVYCGALLGSLPNLLSSATVLLPVKAIAMRSNGRSIIMDTPNVRYCRIDNLTPGEVVTFGSEKWRVYPMWRKSSIDRNGVTWSTGATHSGTFGYAIRVEDAS